MESASDKLAVLKEYFGYTAFRPGQEELIGALLSGRDALGVMPTGAGKSICYQIPALLLPGITLVVSPLISLMKDQVNALTQAGIAAAFLNSSLTDEQYREAFRRARAGRYKLLYVTPERMETESFIRFAENTRISLVAVDEAHCVSQWGQDFRPSYLKIVNFIEHLSYRPTVGAFTATATAEVREDIIRILKLSKPLALTTGFDRANLYFEVAKPKSKSAYLRSFIRKHSSGSGIVYCATRSAVERVCEALIGDGVSATRYHAGLEDGERKQNQEDFIYDRSRVMVATNAFGMGIDKSNVSFVVHYNMPKNLESYYQEAGRAGRDGSAADCVLLFSEADVQTARYFIENPDGNAELSEEERGRILKRDLERLEKMTGYCRTGSCLRSYILDYFGEKNGGRCTNCGNCCGEYELIDITTEAQKILSCVARVGRTYSFGLGKTLYIQILRGSRAGRITQLGLDALPTYGLMGGIQEKQIQEYFDFLVSAGYLEISSDKYPVVRLTGSADEVLFRAAPVRMPVKKKQSGKKSTGRPRGALPKTGEGAPADGQGDLPGALRELRTRLARKAGVPSYIVFSNAVLAELAERRPRNMDELLEVPGIGEVKARRYGREFLKLISDFIGERTE